MALPADEWEKFREKLDELPSEKREEVQDFIEFLKMKEQLQHSGTTNTSLRLQQESLSRIWDDEKELYEL